MEGFRMDMLNAYRAGIVCLSLAIFLVGCGGVFAPVRRIETAPLETTAVSLGDSALVYGRIRWIENGEERTEYKHSYGWNIWPQFLRIDDMESGALSVEADGSFAWKMPRGTYLFHQIYWFDSWDGQHRLTPKVAFQIPVDANAYCLGTLVISVQGKRDIIGGLWLKGVKVKIEDDCEDRDRQFRTRYRDQDLSIAKSLMIFDPRMPKRPEQLEEKDKFQDFIRAITPGLMTIQ
jgi:hypothetical protein